MLVSMLFDEDDLEEGVVTGLFQVGPYVVQIKQKPSEGRTCDRDLEKQQEEAMHRLENLDVSQAPAAENGCSGSGASAASPLAATLCAPSAAAASYISAFPNVGLMVWQAGFVLADYLIRVQPLGAWPGVRVLELGAGVGQLGCTLAMTSAAVTMTDLGHIVPWTERNIGVNAHAMPVRARALEYVWGSELAPAGLGTPGEWDLVVAADVLYEPQYYDKLLASLLALCSPGGGAGGSPVAQADNSTGGSRAGKAGSSATDCSAVGQASREAGSTSTTTAGGGDIMDGLTQGSSSSTAGKAGCGANAAAEQGTLGAGVGVAAVKDCSSGGTHTSNSSYDGGGGDRLQAGASAAGVAGTASCTNPSADAPVAGTEGSIGTCSSSIDPGTSADGAASSGSKLPRCFLCYRVRQYKESGFEAMAAAAGFRVLHVPVQELHEDYRCGGWQLIELVPPGV